MRTALSIAGSDSSGGAGVQADLKTMTMNGVFAMSAITALTAQNTTGVTGIFGVITVAIGNNSFFNVSTASSSNNRDPLVATITGSTTIFSAL